MEIYQKDNDFDVYDYFEAYINESDNSYEKDIEIINRIKTEAKKQSNVVNMYIYFIRALRQAVIKGDISVVCFNTTDYNKDVDFAYLKPNDNPPADQTKLKRFGIPVYDAGGNPSGMITLGTLGYLSFTDDQQGQKEEYEICKYYLNGYETKLIDFYHKNHLDHRGLIPMGLAIDCTNLNIY